MQQQAKATFPKDSDTVIRMFTDQDYFLKKYEMLGASDIQLLECETSGDEFTILVQRNVPADVPVPGFAKKFFSDTMTVVQRDTWNTSTKTGRLEIELKGMPVEVSCDMTLADDGEGSTLTLNWNIKSSVPLVGGKVEKLLWDDFQQKMQPDNDAGVELLANY